MYGVSASKGHIQFKLRYTWRTVHEDPFHSFGGENLTSDQHEIGKLDIVSCKFRDGYYQVKLYLFTRRT